MLRLPSGSRLGLGMKCMGSFILPQVKSESGFTPESAEGNRIHAVLEKYIKAGRSTEKAQIEGRDAEICRRVAATIGPVGLLGESSECKLLLTPGGPRGDRLDRYGDSEQPSEEERASGIYVIADLVGCHSGTSAYVWDFKTGATYIPEPEWNWQLLVPAIGLWTSAGKPDDFNCTVGICHIRESEYDEVSGVYNADVGTIGAKLLSARLEWLRSMVKKAQFYDASSVPLYEGKHCEYCPARNRCPAKVGALATALESTVFGSYTDQQLAQVACTLIDSKPQIDKAAKEMIKMNGLKSEKDGKVEYTYDLGDGRSAVVAVDKRGKEKIYTKKRSESVVGVEGD